MFGAAGRTQVPEPLRRRTIAAGGELYRSRGDVAALRPRTLLSLLSMFPAPLRPRLPSSPPAARLRDTPPIKRQGRASFGMYRFRTYGLASRLGTAQRTGARPPLQFQRASPPGKRGTFRVGWFSSGT
jgi:hypothetical protein